MTSISSRIGGYDVARALAVFGMVLVNYTSMLQVTAFSPPWLKVVVDFIYGRAAVVFVMLAGLSVSLLAARQATPPAMRALRLRLLKRSLLLLMAGMALWHWWEADILHFYAFFIALGAWAMTWRNQWLCRWTALITALSFPVCAALTALNDLGEVSAFAAGRSALQLLALDYAISPYYAVCPWLGFFLAGMLLGRREPVAAPFWRRAALAGVVICATVECISALLLNWADMAGLDIEGDIWTAFLRSEAFPVSPLFIISAGASGVALISLCRLAFSVPLASNGLVHTLATVGQLSLTLYVAHIGWGMLCKQWIGEALSSTQMLMAAGLFDAVGLAGAWLWCRYFRRGPLESLFYYLTAGHRRQREISTRRNVWFPLNGN